MGGEMDSEIARTRRNIKELSVIQELPDAIIPVKEKMRYLDMI